MTTAAAFLDRFAWWQRATARERAVIGAGMAIVAAAVAVSAVVLPLHDALSRAPDERAQRRALLEQAQQRVAAIRAIAPQPAPAADARSVLERALDGRGIARGDAMIDTRDDRIALTLPAARLTDVAAIIDASMRGGLRVSAATLAARADAAELRAEIAFVRTAR